MASIHVTIELDGGHPTEPSLQTLGMGRRLASYLGASLYAVVPTSDGGQDEQHELARRLGSHGADRVILVVGEGLERPLLYATHGTAVYSVCESLPASLVLVAASPGGRDLAPRLAARMGAVFVPEPSVGYADDGELVLTRPLYGGAFRNQLSTEDMDRTIVATITPGCTTTADATAVPGLAVLRADHHDRNVTEVSRTEDPGAVLETATVVVGAGTGVSYDAFGLVSELARALGGEVAVTHEAAHRGLGTKDRIVDIGARRINPRLYIACGASGSAAHLNAVSHYSRIVAVNRDPQAPIFQVAHYGIVGDVETVVPKLLAELQGGKA